jgi:nitric oxide reductase NorQ protein
MAIMQRKLGLVDSIVRDHLYDETKPGAPREHTGISVREMLDEINDIRGSTTDIGAIRRSLRNIQEAGYATKRNVGGGRALAYMWKTGAIIPGDYAYRPCNIVTKGTPSVPVSNLGDKAKRDALDDLLENRMSAISGEKPKPKTTTTPVAPKRAAVAPIPRPSGELYLPRELAGKTDVEVLQALRKAGLYPLLSGPPGGGKTALLEAAFADGNGGMYVLNGDEDTKTDDFVGQLYSTGKGDETYWADGPLTSAMKNGGVLFIDDATLIGPRAISCVYSAMDGRGVIQLKSHLVETNGIMQPELVKAQPGFFVVAAHNPGVAGAVLSDALASRFTVPIWVESDMQLAASLGVNAKFIKLANNLRTRRQKGEYGVFVPEMRDLLAARDLGRILGDKAACEALLGKAPEDFQDDLSAEIRTVFGFDVNPKRFELGGQL